MGKFYFLLGEHFFFDKEILPQMANHGRFKSLERRVDAAIARGSNAASSPFFPNDHEVKEERFLEGGSRFFHQLVPCFVQILPLGMKLERTTAYSPKPCEMSL